jgi:hypothetical protein
MPLTPVGLAGVLLPALAASGMIGTATPQFATGVATGTTLFLQAATVTSIDTGTLGVGAGSVPLLVPQPLLLANVLTGMAAAVIVGPMAPPMALGLANGLSTGLLQGLLVTTHPSVGSGAGVARVVGSGSAVAPMIAGFAAAGMVGPGAVKKATAIGIALDITFAAFVIATPIAGASAPSPGTGIGFGKIV